jgi:sigma-B regulation protein RsbU (phosphoserine phosphatase)
MRESDSSGAGAVRSFEAEKKPMPEISEPYIREQLEKRREQLNAAIATRPSAAPPPPFFDLLQEVDAAIQHIEAGTFGTCEECHGTVELDRLIDDPLVRVCIECLTPEERRALEGDLELASQVQRGLLPQKQVRYGEWHIHYEYKPAGLVSGDYCDLILPSNGSGKLVFLLGDVAGKGVAASLLMTHLHAMFRSLSGSGAGTDAGLELDKMLERANRVFCESTFAGQYATLVCGRTGRSGELEIASAGHHPALLIARDGVRQLTATGLPLGLFSSSRYNLHRVRLEPGDSVLLFTDGISEARNTTGKEYGVTRLSNVAGERHGWVPQELLAACLKDVNQHASGARQTDDQALMVIHRSDSAGASLGE